MPIQVAIVENEAVFAEALQTVLNDTGGVISCQHFFSKPEIALKNLPELKPDVVLMDIDLGEGHINGIECIIRLKPLLPNALFMVLTVYEDHQKVFDALSSGALGYVLKSAKPERIIEAVQELYEGGAPMSPSIARKVANSFNAPAPKPTPESELLTVREKEVIELISKGKLEKEVAAELFISLKTVKAHIANIYAKLQVHTRVEALNRYFGR
ncbi:MAG: response regulator transcription factor [Saprospiraceae bacterium]|jgi:DNA-binding NarL/FixJ family response regulator|nr:response regulator transcription factor [Saprospiraceae bacterium]